MTVSWRRRGGRARKRSDLDEFVACYRPEKRHERVPTWSEDNPDGRWRSFSYDELLPRDKVSLEDSATLPEPDVLAGEISEDLEAALAQFTQIAQGLSKPPAAVTPARG